MSNVQDLSPKLTGIKPASQELALPSLFQDTPNQMVGGFAVGAGALVQGKVSLSGVDQRLLMGDATSPTDGVGIFMGDDGQGNNNYDFRIGDPAGVYLQWDASAGTLTITGFIPDGGAANDVNTNVTTIDGGKITALSITASQIAANTITASQIAAGTITATEIAASTITASKLSISSLDAVSANMGTLTAGTINGGLLTTGGVNIVGNGMAIDNNKLIAFKDTGGSLKGSVYMDTSNRMIFYNTNGETKLGSTNGQVTLVAYNATVLEGHSDGSLYVNSPIVVGGVSKTAIVPTSKGYNALYCAEAPEVWFFDFCKDKQSVDPLFLEVTEGEMKYIQCDDGTYQVWRRRKGYGNTRFEAKTQQEFKKNNSFWSTPFEQAMHQQFATDRDEADTLSNTISSHFGMEKKLVKLPGANGGKPLH